MPSTWEPPAFVSRDEIVRTSEMVFGMPEIPTSRTEDIVTVNTLGLDWDIGVVVTAPTKESDVAVGADGKKIGVFVLHGGSSDFKGLDPLVRLLASRFGFKVFAGTFPGRFYFDNPEHDWPGDTIEEDGSVRTPIWKRGEKIGRDEYEVVQDKSKAERYGTRTFARALPGTNFYYRMAAWPAAFEEGMIAANALVFPADEYSVYGTGHSTGGPFICMLSQRIPNFAGMIAMEHSPFGRIGVDVSRPTMHKRIVGDYEIAPDKNPRRDPFNELYIRTWRDLARYAGPEALGEQGPTALMKLPMLIEQIFEWWGEVKTRPQFKAEYMVTTGYWDQLEDAARVSAERLGMNEEETKALIERYWGYTYELSGDGVPPVPNTLFSIAKNSPDHSLKVYEEVRLPAFHAIRPEPKTRLTQFGAGGHSYWRSLPDLPVGVGPAVGKLWYDAITEGYFLK